MLENEGAVVSTKNKERVMKTASSFESGNVQIFETEGEIIEGLFCGLTRTIGEGDNSSTTIGVLTSENEVTLIPLHAVIERSLINIAKELGKKEIDEIPLPYSTERHIYIKVVYLGKKTNSRNKTYHNYTVSWCEEPIESKPEKGIFNPKKIKEQLK